MRPKGIGLFRPLSKLHREVAAMPAQRYEPTTGFGEMWESALNMTILEDWHSSKDYALSKYRSQRKSTIMDLRNRGEIPDNVFNAFATGRQGDRAIDWPELAAHLKHNMGFKGIKTDEDLLKDVREDLDIVRDDSNSKLANAGLLGKAGYFAGVFHATALDPALLPSWFVAFGGAAKAATILSRTARVAKTGLSFAAVEGGLELARQPNIYSWKQEIGVDYDVSDAMVAVLMAAGVAGGLGATSSALAQGLEVLVKRANPITRMEQLSARILKRTADEHRDIPDPYMTALEHARAIEQERIYQETRPTSPPPDWGDFKPDVSEAKIYSIDPDGNVRLEVREKVYQVGEDGKVKLVKDTSPYEKIFKKEPPDRMLEVEVGKEVDIEGAAFPLRYGGEAEGLHYFTVLEEGKGKQTTFITRSLSQREVVNKLSSQLEQNEKLRANLKAKEAAASGTKADVEEYIDQLPAGKQPQAKAALSKLDRSVEAQARNVTQKPPESPAVRPEDLEEQVVDAAYERLINENPDAEVPLDTVMLDAGEETVQTAKLRDLIKQNDELIERVNKYKECLLNGR